MNKFIECKVTLNYNSERRFINTDCIVWFRKNRENGTTFCLSPDPKNPLVTDYPFDKFRREAMEDKDNGNPTCL